MNTKKILIIVICLLVFVCSLQFYLFSYKKKELVNEQLRTISVQKRRVKDRAIIAALKQSLISNYSITDKQIGDSSFLFAPNGEKSFYKELINSPTLILRFSYKSCNECTDKAIRLLSENHRSIGLNNIIIISNYDEPIHLSYLRDNLINDFAIYNDKLYLNKIPAGDELPYCFVIDKDLQMKDIFLFDKKMDEEFPEYLKLMATCHFNTLQK